MDGRRYTPEEASSKVREGERLLNEGEDLDEVLRRLEITRSTWKRWRKMYREPLEAAGHGAQDLVAGSPRSDSASRRWAAAAYRTGVPNFNPLSPIRQRPWVVVLVVLLFTGIGALYAARLTPTFVASAALVVEDTRRSTLFVAARAVEPERYIADQIAVLKSRAVAERASEIAAVNDPPVEVSVEEVLAGATISSNLQTDFLTISFRASDPTTAQVAANAIGLAYEQVNQARLAEDAANALVELDEAIDDAVQRVVQIQDELAAAQASSVDRQLLEEQMSAIVAELAALRSAAGSTDEIRAKADQLAAELQARLLLTEVEDSAPGVILLLRRLEDGLTLLSELTLRRSQLEVDAQLAGNGVALFSEAGPGTRTGGTLTSTLAVSAVLGGLVGSAGAYWMSERRRRFLDQAQPERLLGVPLLGEIPSMKSRVVDAELAVEAVPRSPGAEAFHALVEEMRRELKGIRGESAAPSHEGEPERGATIAVVSPGFLDGKTVVAVNVTLAASRAGLRSLLLDADHLSQRASSLLSPFGPPGTEAGLAEVVTRGASLGQVLTPISLGGRFAIDLLRLGGVDASGGHLESPAAVSVFDQLTTRYDLVIMDTPPLLQVPEARAVLQKADYAVVVVKHRTPVENLEDLMIRLSLMGVPVLGYVYVRSPHLHHLVEPA